MCHDMPLVPPSLLFQGGGGERSILGKINSKKKGAAGERELAKLLRDYGYDTRRSQQYCGVNGDADVVGLPGIHIECKRVERLNICEAMEQAINDSGANDLPFGYDFPTVFHRKNNCEWLVTMRLEDWLDLCMSGSWTIHYHLKRSEKYSLYDEIESAYKVPELLRFDFSTVCHEKGENEWLVTMKFVRWIYIYHEWESGKALEQE